MAPRPLLAMLLLAFLPAALAQTDEPGCGDAQSRPCEWVVGVEADGIVEGAEMNVTAGEWVRLSVENLDEAAHTLTVEGLGARVEVASYDVGTVTFQATRQGEFVLRDQPTGDTGMLHVLPAGADVSGGTGTGATDGTGTMAQDRSSSTSAKGMPGFGLALLVASLAGALLLRRR